MGMRKPVIISFGIIAAIALIVAYSAAHRLIPDELIASAESFAETYGLGGIAVVAALESIILPVPVAVLIAPTTAFGVDPLMAALVATAGSVAGAAVAYLLGKKLGRPVAERLFKDKLSAADEWFLRYGAWAVFAAAFTPIPFKIFTWGGGIARMEPKAFLLASFVGRFLQFLIAAYVGSLFGWFFIGG